MIPTLFGRWQTRLFIFIIIGLPATFLFSWLYLEQFTFENGLTEVGTRPFLLLCALTVIGFILDVLYIQIQRIRWDQDWPFVFQFTFSIAEFFIAYSLMYFGYLEDIGLNKDSMTFEMAATHFSFVFILSYLFLVCCMSLFFVRWRYKGGEFGRLSS